MKSLTSILVVVDRSDRDRPVLEKAMALATDFGARVELFLCDAEHEYVLRHSYDPSGTEKAREACLVDARQYLESLRQPFERSPVSLSIDATCVSPLYEGLVHKALRSCPDLVMKSPGGEHRGRPALSDNDWQFMRTCPVPLMLVGRHTWNSPPRFAAAVDASSHETPGLAGAILQMAEYIQLGCHGELDVISCERTSATETERQAHARGLNQLASEIHATRQHVHLLDGDPENVLPSFAATRRYDALILGALTHRPGLAPLVGTLTSKLVEALDCDFILVKSPKHTLR
jgi:universal stress protein E